MVTLELDALGGTAPLCQLAVVAHTCDTAELNHTYPQVLIAAVILLLVAVAGLKHGVASLVSTQVTSCPLFSDDVVNVADEPF